MSAGREFEGSTVEEALEAASSTLGIPVGELDYELLDEGRRGVFGLGVRHVRIRVAEPLPASSPPRPEGPPPRADRPKSDRKADISSEVRALEDTVRRMFDLMGLEIDVRSGTSGGNVRLQLAGRDRKMLVEKDGQLLSSVQLLLNRMARRAWPGLGRIQLQCDGYRNRRDEELVELVREVARQVSSTGRPKKLHPMNPYERRLAHLTVREFAGLVSHSDGEGFLKKVTVAPGDPESRQD